MIWAMNRKDDTNIIFKPNARRKLPFKKCRRKLVLSLLRNSRVQRRVLEYRSMKNMDPEFRVECKTEANVERLGPRNRCTKYYRVKD